MATRNLPVELTTLNLPDSGETTLPPAQCIAAGGGSLSTGNFRLVYFTAAKTESITKISTYAATAAAATPTLCRVGIYTIDGSGNLTLAASIANDTTIWSNNGVEYERALDVTFSKVAGTRYAVGSLCVTAQTAPNLAGMQGSNPLINAIAPRIAGTIGSQTDLPASVAVGSIGNTAIRQFFWLKP